MKKNASRNLRSITKKLTILATCSLFIYLLFPFIAQMQSEQEFIETKEQPPEFLIGSNAGDLDPTFLGTGKVSLDFYSNASNYADAVVRQPDGKIVVASDSNTQACVIRYNTDGSLDQTFHNLNLGSNTPKGVACSNFGANDFSGVLLQPDGKIVGIGVYNVFAGDRYTIVTRFNTDGSLDTTFSGDGTLLYSQNGGDDWSRSGVLQADGKIVLVGKVNDVSSAVIRINTDGSLDTTFDGDGIFNFDYVGYSRSIAYKVTIDSSGRIVVGGHALGSNYDYVFARILPSGGFDSTFVGGGGTIFAGTGRIAVQIVGGNDFLYGMVIQPDGKIVGAGYSSASNDDFTVVRLNGSDGSLDTTFDADGKVQTNFGSFNESINNVVLQSDGKIVVCGLTNSISGGGRYDFALARYNPNGSLDTTFDTDGRVTTQFNANNSDAQDIVIQPDGKIVAAGRGNWTSVDFAAARYNPNGSLDTSWGVGKRSADIANDADHAEGVAQQADGKLVTVGRSDVSGSGRITLTRHNTDGTLDTSFDGDGKVITAILSSDAGYAIAIQPGDQKIVIGGTVHNGSAYDFVVVRYNTNGSLDTSFSGDGIVTHHFSSDEAIHAIAVQSDGKIVAAGYTNNTLNYDMVVLRYTSTGVLDTSFDGDGVKIINVAGNDYGFAMGIDSNGKLVIGGGATPSSRDFSLVRLNSADGSFDTTFDGDGIVTTAISGNTEDLRAIAFQSDGKIVVSGYANTGFGNGEDFVVARYNTNGSLDTSFDFDGIQVTTFSSLSDISNGVAIQVDGKILVSGYALAGSHNDYAFARYNSDGSLDSTFGNGGRRTYDFSGYHDYANGNLIIQSDGKAVTVGESFNGLNYDFGIIRILTNSAADCSYSLNLANQNVLQAGGSHSVNVTTTSSCTWTATSNVSWLNFTGSTNGTGNGTINYSVDANPNAVSRTGTITVGGQTLTVTQYGANMLVSIPTTLTGQNGSVLTVPISVNDTTGQDIISYDFTLTYDQSVLTPQVTPYDTTGTLSSGFTITVNATTPGTLVVSGFGSTALTGAGTLLNLKFNVVGTYPNCSNLNFTAFEFNSGNPPDQTSNGQFCVINGNITGTITYVNGSPTQPAVQNVTVTAVGSTTIADTTDAAGFYELTGFSAGAYTVTPTKTDDVNGITALDASLVAQHVVGLTTLSSTQQTAGDASNNGSLNSFDAALIAQFAVNITNPLSIAGTWKFSPASRNYASVITDTPNQNYGAILVGEVTGNWTPPPPFVNFIKQPDVLTNPPIDVNFPNAFSSNGQIVTVPITVGKELSGNNVLAYQLDFNYNPSILQPDPVFTSQSGTISNGMTVTVNNSTSGRSRIAVFGTANLNGQGTLINLRFHVIGAPGQVSPLNWSVFVFNEGTPNSTAGNGSVTVLIPTAANVSVGGRIAAANGNGIRNAVVTLTDANGATQTTRSSTFGYYHFDNIPIGTTVISVSSKRFTFANPTQVINVSENLSDIDFTAIE